MMKLVTGGLYTIADADTDDDNDNNTRWTEHDCIGSLPNEPKKTSKYTSPGKMYQFVDIERHKKQYVHYICM